MLKLKLQYFGHLMQRLRAREENEMVGEHHQLRELVKDREAWHAAVPKCHKELDTT